MRQLHRNTWGCCSCNRWSITGRTEHSIELYLMCKPCTYLKFKSQKPQYTANNQQKIYSSLPNCCITWINKCNVTVFLDLECFQVVGILLMPEIIWNRIPTDRLYYIILCYYIHLIHLYSIDKGFEKKNILNPRHLWYIFLPADFVRLSQAPGNPGDSALCSWRVSSWSYPSAGQQWKSNTKDGWKTSIKVEES